LLSDLVRNFKAFHWPCSPQASSLFAAVAKEGAAPGDFAFAAGASFQPRLFADWLFHA
jgi:hypothetical protein